MSRSTTPRAVQSTRPRVLLLGGGSLLSLPIAKELTEDLEATIIGVGRTRYSRLLRSRYCDIGVTTPPTNHPEYIESLRSVIDRYQPDIVVPTGYDSVAALEGARETLSPVVGTCLPPRESFHHAVDKSAAAESAEAVGLETPTEYSTLIADLDARGRPAGGLDALEFPVFCKPTVEVGGGHDLTARINEPGAFWETYDRIVEGAPTDDVLVQECVTGTGSTYGCGLLFFENELECFYTHEEVRSVPRRGGIGTRLRVVREPTLEAKSIELLRRIGWHGLALVEFRKRADGTFVFMEINPKFWASYALASATGYRFASTMVARTLGLPETPITSPAPTGEMAFPLRELEYYVKNRDEERLSECLRAMVSPGVAWSVDRSDLRAWLTPPASLTERLPTVETPSEAEPTADSTHLKNTQ